MNPDNRYIVDTSSLVNLMRWNPIDIYVTVWQKVGTLVRDGSIVAPQEVMNEILVGDDELNRWASNHRRMFRKLTPFQVKKVFDIVSKFPSISDSDKDTAVADPFVVAMAIEENPSPTLEEFGKKRIVVCDEKSHGKRIKIPTVCGHFGIECIDIHELFRIEGWTF